MAINRFITSAEDLVTSREETRTGFINFALEKNRKSTPYIEQARLFRTEALKAKNPKELMSMKSIQASLLAAAGLSDKALRYFTEADKNLAIEELIKNFLEPAGKNFVDEAVYRFLLIKGDSLGGSMRNFVGQYAEQKLVRVFLAQLQMRGIQFRWLRKSNTRRWIEPPSDLTIVETDFKAFTWKTHDRSYILAMNLRIPIVDKKVDICLFKGNEDAYRNGQIVNETDKIIMLGELKGGIDPAGADEHWKTANTALERIRTAFGGSAKILTSFVGAAIEVAMSEEIFAQLQDGTMTNAANFSDEEQLGEYCGWLVDVIGESGGVRK